MIAAFHIFSYHHGELVIYHEGTFLFLAIFFILFFRKDT